MKLLSHKRIGQLIRSVAAKTKLYSLSRGKVPQSLSLTSWHLSDLYINIILILQFMETFLVPTLNSVHRDPRLLLQLQPQKNEHLLFLPFVIYFPLYCYFFMFYNNIHWTINQFPYLPYLPQALVLPPFLDIYFFCRRWTGVHCRFSTLRSPISIHPSSSKQQTPIGKFSCAGGCKFSPVGGERLQMTWYRIQAAKLGKELLRPNKLIGWIGLTNGWSSEVLKL